MSEAASRSLAAELGSGVSTSEGRQLGEEMPMWGDGHPSEDDLLGEAEFRRRVAEGEVDDVVAEIELVRARMEQRARSFAAKLGMPAGNPSVGQVAVPASARCHRGAPSRSERGNQRHPQPRAHPPDRHNSAGEVAGAGASALASRTRDQDEEQQSGMPPDVAFMESICFCRDVSFLVSSLSHSLRVLACLTHLA